MDPYVILGVERSSTLPEIKSAFRRLALKLHPDKLHHDVRRMEGSGRDFMLVQKAYAFLTGVQQLANLKCCDMEEAEELGTFLRSFMYDEFVEHALVSKVGGYFYILVLSKHCRPSSLDAVAAPLPDAEGSPKYKVTVF